MITIDNEFHQVKLIEQPWDSNIFGFLCGSLEIINKKPENNRINSDRNDDILESSLCEIISSARKEKFRFITAKINAQKINVANVCFRNHGILIDTELTYQKTKHEQLEKMSLPKGFAIYKHDRYWNESLLELTNTLTHSRFFMDKNIDVSTAQKLWNQSIFNNCNGRANYTVVCFDKDRPIGIMNIFEKDETSDIFLIAVLPSYQNMGLGKAMVHFYENNLDPKITKLTVETQLINYQAQYFYIRLGYKNVRSKYIIHFWL